MGQHNFKVTFEFHSFSEIFYCGMASLRNTNLDVFTQYQHTRTILRNRVGAEFCLRNVKSFKNSMKYYTDERPDLGTLN